MKLRIRGNSIRLRLTRGETERVAAGETVEETVDLAPAKFIYSMLVGDTAKIETSFAGGRLSVLVPATDARAWANSDAVGMESADGPVKILIEKDFACVKPRSGEDESDMFDHPNPAAC